MRIIYVYVEERTLTLPSSFNCMPNFLQSYPQHYAICLTQNIGEFPNLLLAQYMLLEDQTLTLSSFFNCTIRLTSARPRIAITTSSSSSMHGIRALTLMKVARALVMDPLMSPKILLTATETRCFHHVARL